MSHNTAEHGTGSEIQGDDETQQQSFSLQQEARTETAQRREQTRETSWFNESADDRSEMQRLRITAYKKPNRRKLVQKDILKDAGEKVTALLFK